MAVNARRLFPELAIFDRLRSPPGRVYPAEAVTAGIVTVDGTEYMIDAVEIIPGEPGCEDETVAYLSLIDDTGG